MADEKTLTALYLSVETRERMEQIKKLARISFTDQVEAGIGKLHADLFPAETAPAAVVLGYLRLDRLGDIEAAEMTCAECAQDIHMERGAFIAVLKSSEDVTLGNAPLCAACTSSE